jgi:putative protease
MEVHGREGTPLTLIARDELGTVVQLDSALPLTAAERQPLDDDRLRAQLGRLGGTPFTLRNLINQVQGRVILPVSELNRLRRELVTQLSQRRAEPRRWAVTTRFTDPPSRTASETTAPAVASGPDAQHPQLIALVRTLPQLAAALESECELETIYCEFEDPKKYRDAVALTRGSGGGSQPTPSIWVAPPRIFKAGEEWILKLVRSSEPDGFLVRNFDHLQFFAGCRMVGDFSFNVANRWSAEWLREEGRLERLTASYDLNGSQLMDLVRSAPRDWFEVTIHQHMPMFHMEHCVFCAFLSTGTDYSNCGRPCDRHEVRLRDRVGAEHVLKADAGCRNTVFNAMAQTGAELVGDLLALGTRYFRVEFAQESAGQVRQTLRSYRQLLRGEITGAALWRELKLVNQLGVTRGSLEQR